ncbi:MAG: hypothetical protein DMG85_12305 [Acidobacteria bacterium]|nr:MAG: hypothetical protein DMG85_12305 [Acidobacteriota bacterium]
MKIARVFTILGVIGMFPSFTLAQTTDPSVGSWNFKVTVTGECTTNSKYIGIGVLSHNRLNERNRLLATVIWQIVADSAMLRLRTT